ncbi:type II toxin-antitoxin system PemK/MazF family toxin [Gemmata sp. JC717]|uniref:type II toxin-antitoxin system PemK/MazF family toxin n=1 Tax=Gemmata algarum TaxID=2975278 RepID=UPI0028E0A136|nr:type II toxin-antitoxin system PemK/MazF family toxin [Gemmata algarum]MDY3556482.1 type II toxin-antitoxin system PemK/MazF family toxin [Gemmata algarum]
MQPGEVYWVDFPQRGGREQAGRRPSIVLQDDTAAARSPMVFVIPLTTRPAVTRYPGVVPVPVDVTNGLTADSYALVFQFGATDRQRVGDVSAAILAEIYKALDALTGHP